MVARALNILTRRGEIPPVQIDGRTVDLRYRSPLAAARDRSEAQSALTWLKTIGDMGPEASSVVDVPAFARWFADKMAVPQQLLRQPMNLIDPTIDAVEAIASIADAGPEDLANALAPEAMEEAQ